MARILTGRVSSASPDKTIVISVVTKKTHPIYKKQFSRTKKFMAHDENNECKVGDKVSIIETKPISARKHFRLNKIVEKAKLTKEDLHIIEADETEKDKAGEDKQKDAQEAKPAKPEKEAAK